MASPDITLAAAKTRIAAMTALPASTPCYTWPLYATEYADTALQASLASKLGGITIFPHEFYAGTVDLPAAGVNWGILLQPQQFVDTPVTNATIDAGYLVVYEHLQTLWRAILDATDSGDPAFPSYAWIDFEGDSFDELARLQTVISEDLYGFFPACKQVFYGAGQVNSVHVPTFLGDHQGIVSYYPDSMSTTDSIMKAAYDNRDVMGSPDKGVGVWFSTDYTNTNSQFGNTISGALGASLGARFSRKLATANNDSAAPSDTLNTVPANARYYNRIRAMFLYHHRLPPDAEAWRFSVRYDADLTKLENFVSGAALGL